MRGDHIDARCPAHDDRHPSLSVDWRGGRTLMRCHGGERGGCTAEEIVEAIGLQMTDLFDEKGLPHSARSERPAHPGRRAKVAREQRPEPEHRFREVATYTYTDADGEIVAQVIRRECEGCPDCPPGQKPSKTFSWRHPTETGWMWNAPDDRPLYRLTDVLAAAEQGRLIYVVEGEKSADALAELGFTATTKGGGTNAAWTGAHTAALVGADVIVIADRDTPGYRAAAEVAQAIAPVARSVRVVRAAVDEAKADIVEHLAAGYGLDDLEDVPAALLEPAALPDFEPELEPFTPDEGLGEVVVPFRRKRGGGGGDDDEPVIEIVRDKYRAYQGELIKLDRKAHSWRTILNAEARLLCFIQAEPLDGLPPLLTHMDVAIERAGRKVLLENLTRERYEKCEWVNDAGMPGLEYERTSHGRSDLMNAISATSGDVPTETLYTTLGWKEREDGKWMFVHAGGAINEAGSMPGVRVQVSDDLKRYTLPSPAYDPNEIATDLAASLMILDRLPAAIAAPLLGAAYRAVLGDAYSSVFFVGRTGTFKTSLATLALQHHAPKTRYDSPLIGAGEDAATDTALEELRHGAGHFIFLADDLAPDRSTERSSQRANRLLRSQFNSAGKRRGRRDGGVRKPLNARSLLMITGEDGASAESAENRTLYVPLERGDVEFSTLQELHTRELALARGRLTATLIAHHAKRAPANDWIADVRDDLAGKLPARTGIEARRAKGVADLAVGWCAMLEMAVAHKAIDLDTARNIWRRAWRGLLEAYTRQGMIVDGRTTPERVAELLRSALIAGLCHIAAPTGGVPGELGEARSWGWDAPTMEGARWLKEEVGWTDGNRLWLDPGAVVAVIESQGSAQGEPMNMTPRALQLALADVLRTQEASEDGRTCIRHATLQYIHGKRRRVWDLPVSWLFPDDADDAGEPAAQADPDLPFDPPFETPADVVTDEQLAFADTREGISRGIVPAAPAADVVTTEEAPGPDVTVMSGPAVQGYFAAAAVLDADGAWLPDGSRLPLPPLNDLVDVVAWAEEVGLGIEHKNAPSHDGQVWLMPAIAAAIGLPHEAPPRASKGAARALHPALAKTRAAGYESGELKAWTKVWRPGGRSLRIVVVPWLTLDECPLLVGDDDPSELARRVGRYIAEVGIPYWVSPAMTGVDLMSHQRRGGRYRLEAVEPPAPALQTSSQTHEIDFRWMRELTPEERGHRFVHAFDLNGMYLSAASSVELGLGAARHVENPSFEGKLPPGYWLVSPPRWTNAKLPDPFDPAGHGYAGKAVWVATPTLQTVREIYDLSPTPIEAYVWDESARYLEPWYEGLRDARKRLLGAVEADDPDAGVVLRTVKRTYAAGIGLLGSQYLMSGRPLYRPDWRHHVLANARGRLLRRIERVAEQSGRYPVAIFVDALLYTSDEADPALAVPAGLALGSGLGEAKPDGVRAMADVAELLEQRQLSGLAMALNGEPLEDF
jgi:hypothetical protein